MQHLFSIFLCVLFFSTPVLAGEKEEVRELLEARVAAVMTLLQNKSVDKESRDKQIINIVTPIFGYQTMAKLSLGKKHWPKLSQEEQTEFSNLFIERLQDSYLSKLDIYSDEKILYGDPHAAGNKIHVPSTLVSKGQHIEMLYKFYHSSKGWKIYDVEIGGVSIIQTYRSQFDEALSHGTINDLLAKLKSSGNFQIPAPGEEKVLSGRK